jgi:hypothetical protein
LTDDPGDEPITTPKLNCGAFEKLLGFFDSFVVVFANEAPVPNKMGLGSDEIGPVILHVVCPKGSDGKKLRLNGRVDTGPLLRPATQYP